MSSSLPPSIPLQNSSPKYNQTVSLKPIPAKLRAQRNDWRGLSLTLHFFVMYKCGNDRQVATLHMTSRENHDTHTPKMEWRPGLDHPFRVKIKHWPSRGTCKQCTAWKNTNLREFYFPASAWLQKKKIPLLMYNSTEFITCQFFISVLVLFLKKYPGVWSF